MTQGIEALLMGLREGGVPRGNIQGIPSPLVQALGGLAPPGPGVGLPTAPMPEISGGPQTAPMPNAAGQIIPQGLGPIGQDQLPIDPNLIREMLMRRGLGTTVFGI